MKAEKKDIYEEITNQIVAAIENGAGDYRMPWHRTGADTFAAINVTSKKHYRGVNVLSLWASAEKNGYTSGLWGTYKQWQELGAQVKKGEKSTLVAFWKFLDKEQESETEGDEHETRTGKLVLARGYSVFNAAQVDGYTAPAVDGLSSEERIEHAERFFSSFGAEIRHGGTRAYYSPLTDHIQIPDFEAFVDAPSYYSVLGHEATHWTGTASRLNRDLANRFGSAAYAAEELVAELGAAFLCSSLGLSTIPRPDHASYLSSWLEVLKNDKRAVFTAAAKAQQAADYLEQLGKREERAAA